jgi:XTP/dITP diphosphohydrolase
MKLKVITSNPGKVKEFEESLGHLGMQMEHLRHPYDEVQTSDLEEVVRKGMEEIKKDGVRDFIIDDSGLFIDSLNGFPGVWSAYAQKTIGNKGILRLMDGVKDRNAEFRCCIGCDIKGETIIVTGVCRGTMLEKEQGAEGFGYDPIFTHDGKFSFAEISTQEKNKFSHRGNAIEFLVREMKKRNIV